MSCQMSALRKGLLYKWTCMCVSVHARVSVCVQWSMSTRQKCVRGWMCDSVCFFYKPVGHVLLYSVSRWADRGHSRSHSDIYSSEAYGDSLLYLAACDYLRAMLACGPTERVLKIWEMKRNMMKWMSPGGGVTQVKYVTAMKRMTRKQVDYQGGQSYLCLFYGWTELFLGSFGISRRIMQNWKLYPN